MGQFQHYCMIERDEKVEEIHCRELDPVNFRVDRIPVVLCFGGNETLDAKDANYMCGCAQRLVGAKEPSRDNEIASTKDVRFIGIGYGLDQEGYGANAKPAETSSLTEEEITELENNIFAPLYLNGICPKPREEILKNFNLITFFSHCHGAEEINKLTRKAYQNMLAFRVDEQTARDAINQIFSVSYAPQTNMSCPNLQVIPERDDILGIGPANSYLTYDFLLNRHRFPGKGTVAFKENDHTISLIVSDMTKRANDEHNILYATRNERWEWEGEHAAEEDHENFIIGPEPAMAYGNEVSMAMSVALSESIASGIRNQHSAEFTPKPSLDKMLKKVQSILGTTQSSQMSDAIKQLQTPDREQ